MKKVYKKSLQQYYQGIEYYNHLSKYINKKFDIPTRLVDEQIKKDIYLMFTSKSKDKYFNYHISIKDLFFIFSFYLYLIVSLPISLIYYMFLENKKYDIIYEEMWPGKTSTYKRFYKYIDEILEKNNTALLLSPIYKPLKKIKKMDEYVKKKVIRRGLSNFLFLPKDLLLLISRDLPTVFMLLSYSKKSKLNLIMMYIRLVRRILLYKAQTYNISAKVLIGANDYYWNPTKYYIYKSNGFKNIILLQHNYKHGIDLNSLYIYCDIYFADSKSALSVSQHIIAKEKHAIGNLQLAPFVDTKKNKVIYDIFIVHHPIKTSNYDSNSDVGQAEIFKMYELFLSHIENFAKKFPAISLVYVSKKFTDDKILYYDELKARFKNIKNIKCVTKYGAETYHLINESTLIVNLFSSLGVQSYGLGKRVFWININHVLNAFGLPNKNENIDVLVEPQYDIFEQKLLNLLQNNSEDMKSFTENKKQEYMNIQENPAKIVADKVLELLKVENR